MQIYRPQLTAVMSISHRIAGVALAAGTLLLVYWISSAAYGPESYAAAQAFLGSWFGYLILFAWSIALYYHLCNGIRHLLWDVGKGFEIPQVYQSGQAVLAATAALTFLTWIIALSA